MAGTAFSSAHTEVGIFSFSTSNRVSDAADLGHPNPAADHGGGAQATNLDDGAMDIYAEDDYSKPKRPGKADVGVYPAEAARPSDDQEGRGALWRPRRDYEAVDMARYLLFTRMPVSSPP